MKKITLEFIPNGLGFSAVSKNKRTSGDYYEIAYISQHGSVVWKLTESELSKIDYSVSAKIQNFAAGVAYYHSVEHFENA